MLLAASFVHPDLLQVTYYLFRRNQRLGKLFCAVREVRFQSVGYCFYPVSPATYAERRFL